MPDNTLIHLSEELIQYERGELEVQLLGGLHLSGLDRMRVTVKVQRKGNINPHEIFRTSLDLYSLDEVAAFIQQASETLVLKALELANLTAELIRELEIFRLGKLESTLPIEEKPELSEKDKKQALNYLKDKRLIEKTGKDLERVGIVGEENNRLLTYLIFTSRKTENPLHLIVTGKSGTGKSHLIEKVSELIPQEEIISATSLSDNSLYYFEKNFLKNKLLILEDLDGSGNTLYPLREIQSRKRLTKLVSIKDSKGRIRTEALTVEGNLCIASTTTKEKLYQDNLSRSLVLHPDESSQQDKRIISYQKQKAAGKINEAEQEKTKLIFKNVQRMLRPMKVINPFAESLHLPASTPSVRRANQIYLTLIETIAFYHQYQRELKTSADIATSYIEVIPKDIELADKLMKDLLIQQADDLTKGARTFLEKLSGLVQSKEDKTEAESEQKKQAPTFATTEVVSQLKIHPSSVKRYMLELIEKGYVSITGGIKERGYTYELMENHPVTLLKTEIEAHFQKEALSSSQQSGKKQTADSASSS